MSLITLQDIERAIDRIPRHLPHNAGQSGATVFEEGLGLFGSPDDAALIDEVVHIAYEERRRPSRSSPVL